MVGSGPSTAIEVPEEFVVVVRTDGSAWSLGGLAAIAAAALVATVDRPEDGIDQRRQQQQEEDEPEHRSSLGGPVNRRPGGAARILGPVKPFLIYTGLRIGLFALVYTVLITAALVIGLEGASFWLLLVAALVSSVLSVRLLAPQRDALAQSVQARAERATAKFEAMKASEDED